MTPHIFQADLLKECDIRGIFGKELTCKDAYFIGRSFGTWLIRQGTRTCVVGYDGRLSSPSLCLETEKGLIDSGIDVFHIGLIPTPVVYFAVNEMFPGGGIMITASHNPPEYNGFKFLTNDGPFFAEYLEKLAEISRESDFTRGKGKITRKSILAQYISHLTYFIDRSNFREFRIVWDPGNGAVSITLPLLLRHIPGDHKVICGEVDGTFPNHHADPNVEENVKMLKEAVIENQADFGIAFDGDGDRIGVVDGEGYLLKGDQLLAVYARHFLARNPGFTVMSEVKASKMLYDDIASRGGKPLMWKVGHTNQKKKMAEENIQLAGETSGHIFFGENGGHDDALFAALKLISILSVSKETLSEIRKGFPLYHDTGEIRIPLESRERKRVISGIVRRMSKSGRSFIAIDGLRVSCEDGFWLIRESNTMPDLTIRCEASSRNGFKACISELEGQLSASGIAFEVSSKK